MSATTETHGMRKSEAEEETEAGARGSPGSVASERQATLRGIRTPAAQAQPAARGGGRQHIHRESDTDDAVLDDLQKKAFHFFEVHVNPDTGLVLDSTQPESPCSIAAVGFALSSYPVAVERGWMPRELGLSHALLAARFFHEADQSGDRKSVV